MMPGEAIRGRWGVSPLTGDREFESISLQQRVDCEPDSLDQGGEIASLPDSLPLDWAGAQNNLKQIRG
jgi:hypothetical protein